MCPFLVFVLVFHSVDDPRTTADCTNFLCLDVQHFECFSTHYLQMSSHYFVITYSSGPDRLVNAICWPKNITLRKLRIRLVNCIRPLKKIEYRQSAVTVDWVSLSFPLDAFPAAISIWIFSIGGKTSGISYRTAEKEAADAENTTLKSFIEWINALKSDHGPQKTFRHFFLLSFLFILPTQKHFHQFSGYHRTEKID